MKKININKPEDRIDYKIDDEHEKTMSNYFYKPEKPDPHYGIVWLLLIILGICILYWGINS
jgi:hypothetical protein